MDADRDGQELSAEQILALLPEFERSALILQWTAESIDISPTTARSIEEVITRQVPDDADDEARHQFAEALVELFHLACKDFLVARTKYGLNEPPGVKRPWNWEVNSSGDYGARAFVDEQGHDSIRIEGGTLDFLLWASLKYAAAKQSEETTSVCRRAPGRKTGGLLYRYDIPSDPGIRSFAFLTALTAFQFVFFHEMGHHSQGHCRYLASGLSDYNLDAEEISPNLERQSLELMADIFAVRELMALFKSRREVLVNIPSAPTTGYLKVQRDTYLQDALATACVGSALACLFYLTSEGGGWHPRREFRFIAALMAFKSFAAPELAKSNNDWLRGLCNVVSHVGDAMQESHFDEDTFKFLTEPLWNDEDHPEVMSEILGLIKRSEQIKPAIMPYARYPQAFIGFDAEALK